MHKPSKLRPLLIAAVAMAAAAVVSCESVDNHRIPAATVMVNFNTIGDWQIYGVNGAGQTRNFIRQTGEPFGFPYTVAEQTGYGGIMLVGDPLGEYLAFDLACPVEVKPDIRVVYDTSTDKAGIVRCPKCGSTYDIYTHGTPLSGEALRLKYGLEEYRVFVGNPMPPYAYIRR